MKTNNNNETLKFTLEEIRAKKYSDIPSNLISQLIDIQSNNEDSEERAHALIKDTIGQFLNETIKTE